MFRFSACAVLLTVAHGAEPSINTENGELHFEAVDFKFQKLSGYPALIEETKQKIQDTLAEDGDAQTLLDLLKQYNEEFVAESDTCTFGAAEFRLTQGLES